VKKSQLKVLALIYRGTDCCNEVFDYTKLHWTQERIADSMPELVSSIDGVVTVDGDGFMLDPERCGRGFRLTLAGYEALTEHDPEGYPPHLRRFAAITGAPG
jgi:hypothetical protein